jgi:hypothetical protein
MGEHCPRAGLLEFQGERRGGLPPVLPEDQE